MTMRRRLQLAIAGCVLGAAGYGGFALWRATEQRKILATALPEAPNLASQPDALRRRIDDGVTRVRAGNDRIAALGELSRLYHANGFHAAADACYRALARLQPGEPRWPHRHAMLLAGFGDVEAALPLARRAVSLAPDYAPARLRLGDLLLKSNRFDEATTAYTAVLARHPNERHATFGLARCDFEAGRWEQARQRLEPLVAETGYRLGYDLIVTVYERLGLHAQAAAVRGRQRASGAYRDPEDPWVDALLDDCYDPYRLSILAGSLAEAGDTAAAIRRLEQAIALSPRNHALHFQLAGVHLATKSYAKAREQLQLCTTITPEFPDAWALLSDLFQTIGDRASAESTLAEGLLRCPGSPGLHLMLARRLQQAGRIDEAIAEFRASIKLRPNEAETSIELARWLIKLDRLDEARAEFDHALVAEPEHPGALAILAIDAITRGDENAARALVRRALNQPRTPAEQMSAILDAYRAKFGRRFDGGAP